MTPRPTRHLAFLLIAMAAWLGLRSAHAEPHAPGGTGEPARTIVVTFDDLPAVAVVGTGIVAEKAMTSKLLRSLGELRVPAIGFVNEGKLFSAAAQAADPERLALLRLWLEAGLELGNHTYSHHSLHKISTADYAADIERGETLTRPLMAAHHMRMRYFRHPFLHTGTDIKARQAIDLFLGQRGYEVAPVTVDNDDYVFAAAYARAGNRSESGTQDRIAGEYIRYMEAMMDYYEKQSDSLFGRAIPQVLLLHANQINADRFGDLARMLRSRGYRFVSLQAALADPAYRSVDGYIGPRGISWLHRWALTKGGQPAIAPGEPAVPAWIVAQAAP